MNIKSKSGRYGLGLFRQVLSARSRLDLTHTIVLPQQSKFSVTRDLNYSKLTLCRLQTVATARGKVYQVNILVVCSPSKAKEDSQRNSDSEECP